MPSPKKRKFLLTLGLSIFTLFMGRVLVLYFNDFPIPELMPKILAVVSALFLLCSLAAMGQTFLRLVSKWMGWTFFDIPAIWRFNFSAGLGAGLVAILTLALGGLAPGPLHTKLLLLKILLMAFFIWKAIPVIKMLAHWRAGSSISFSMTDIIWVVLAAGGMAFSLLACFSPITYYDSLVYHVALPAYYQMMGSINAVPFNLYSYFPANTEMIYLLALDQLPEAEYTINLLGWAASLGISCGLYQWVKEHYGKGAGWMAMGLWWTTPAVLFLSVGGYVDIFLAFYTLLGFYAFSRAMQTRWNTGWLFLAALGAGLAGATKYTGMAVIIFLSLYLAYQTLRKELLFKKWLFFSGIALLPLSPWLLRNAVTVKNPFFPFFYRFFGGTIGWTEQTAEGYFRLLTEYGAKSHMVWELLQAPWHIATRATRFGGGFDVLGDFGWPLFIFGSLLAFFLLPWKREQALLKFYFAFQFIFWFVTKPVLRFLFGHLPPLVFLTVGSLCVLVHNKSLVYRFLTSFIVGLWLLSNFFIIFFINDVHKPFLVPLGLQTRTDYMVRYLPYYRIYDFINHHLSATDKILLVGEQRGYHLKIPYLISNYFAPSQMAQWCNAAGSAEEIRHQIEREKITHILVNESEINRLGGLSALGFSTVGSRHFLNLIHNLRMAHGDNSLSLFAINTRDPN
ncbi:MAG: glycosyltransferase family 39 protein [Elusimicrobia bacterium]|nr:glycosyltransferase family 39 protein [Candidatus Obscuribacterium magneticum]